MPPVFIVNTFVYSQTVESPRWSDERDVTTNVLYHLTELLKLITNCSYVIFYWPLTNVLLLESPIIDTIYLVKLVLIDNLKRVTFQISVVVMEIIKRVSANFIFIKVL